MAINKPSVFIGENDQEQLYVTQANTGINTTNPTEKLEIAGNCKADFFIGDGSLLTNVGGGGGNLLPLDNTWTGLNTFTAGLLSEGTGTGSFRAGLNAGLTNQAVNAIAVGRGAGSADQQTLAVALGNNAGVTSQGSASVAVGVNAGNTTQGANAVAIGNQAGETTQSDYATAVGVQAGETTQGQSATAVGRNAGKTDQGASSVAIGRNAALTGQGSSSVAIGQSAGQTDQGQQGIIISSTSAALDDTTAGHIHIASDDGSLDFTTAAGWTVTGGNFEVTGGSLVSTGNNNSIDTNTSVGLAALSANTVGIQITAVGRSAGIASTANNGTFIGHKAGQNVSTGTSNALIGNYAGSSITTGANNTVVGSLSGTDIMSSTVLIGAGATERIKADSTGLYVNGILIQNGSSFNGILATGDFEAITGNGVFYGAQGVTTNLAIGDGALAVSVGSAGAASNVAVGANALNSNTTGINNVAIGGSALQVNVAGDRNVAIGAAAMLFATGSDNVVIGESAGGTMGAGSRNTVIGRMAPAAINDTVLIGAGATERIKVDASGMSVNGVPLSLGISNFTTGGTKIFTDTDYAYVVLFNGVLTLNAASSYDVGRTFKIYNMHSFQIQLSGTTMFGLHCLQQGNTIINIPLLTSITVICNGVDSFYIGY